MKSHFVKLNSYHYSPTDYFDLLETMFTFHIKWKRKILQEMEVISEVKKCKKKCRKKIEGTYDICN